MKSEVHRNHFDTLRLLFTVLVIFSHSYPILRASCRKALYASLDDQVVAEEPAQADGVAPIAHAVSRPLS